VSTSKDETSKDVTSSHEPVGGSMPLEEGGTLLAELREEIKRAEELLRYSEAMTDGRGERRALRWESYINGIRFAIGKIILSDDPTSEGTATGNGDCEDSTAGESAEGAK
jgi:hypothetical protein